MNALPLLLFSCILALSCFGGVAASPSLTPGTFIIETSPSGADVYADGTYLGTSPVRYQVSPERSSIPAIQVKRDGYQPEERRPDRSPGSGEEIRISIDLIPTVIPGRISVTSSPPGAYASLDGGPGYQTPYLFQQVSSGTHTITLSLPGYTVYEARNVFVTSGASQSVHGVLSSLQLVKTGTLSVRSSPSGADVRVDRIYRGQTRKGDPLRIGGLSIGSHEVVLSLSGYEVLTDSVLIFQGKNSEIDVSLNSVKKQATTGSLSVSSAPPGADVMMNHQWVGYTPDVGSLDIPDLPPNRYKVVLSLPGYEDYSEWVYLTPGSVIPVEAALKPAQKAPGVQNGTVIIESDPAGALITLNMTYQGTTPRKIENVTPGTYRLTYNVQGYVPVNTTIEVTSGQVITKLVNLLPIGR